MGKDSVVGMKASGTKASKTTVEQLDEKKKGQSKRTESKGGKAGFEESRRWQRARTSDDVTRGVARRKDKQIERRYMT